MKKSKMILAITMMMVSGMASAQKISDNLYQVVSRWQKGEKMTYENSSEKYNISGTDTTLVEKSSELTYFQVLEATDSIYRVRYTTSDFKHSDYIRTATMEAFDNAVGEFPVDFETSSLGVPLRVLPCEWDTANDALQESITDELCIKLDSLKIDREQLKAYLKSVMPTPEQMQLLVNEWITMIFQCNGYQFETGRDYTFEAETPSIFSTTGRKIKMNGLFWVDEDYSNEEQVCIIMKQEIDEDDVALAAKEYMMSLIAASGQDVAIPKEVDNIKYKVSDTYVYSIHLGSGWPLYFVHGRDVQIFNDGECINHQYSEESLDYISQELP